jgi:hypothetical protein
MDLVGNDVDTLHEDREYLVGHLMGNDVDTLYEERIYLVRFSFIRVIDNVVSVLYKFHRSKTKKSLLNSFLL